MTDSAAPNETAAPRPRGYYRWPIIIIGLIGLQLLLGAITLYFATRDPSFALVPNAYARENDANQRAQAKQASDALGWTYELRIGEPDPIGDRYVFVTLTDADGQPIESATLAGQAYHQARAKHILGLDFRAVSPGLYRVQAPIRRDGLWVISLAATRGDDVFLIDTTSYIGQWRP